MNIVQIIINIVFSASIYLLISLSFSMIFYSSKFFHLAHAGIITLGAYTTYFFYKQLLIPLYLAIFLSIFLSSIVGSSLEKFIYNPLRKRSTKNINLLIVSLGIYIIIKNILIAN